MLNSSGDGSMQMRLTNIVRGQGVHGGASAVRGYVSALRYWREEWPKTFLSGYCLTEARMV